MKQYYEHHIKSILINYFLIWLQGSWYHKNCFRCVDCTRMLDSLSNNDGLDGLYCKGCYNVKFGPQVRSTDVEHKIIDTSSIKSEDPKKNCPRCSGAVFSAESIPCKDRKYHKKCASCASCEKPLTYNTVFNGTLQLTLRAPILIFYAYSQIPKPPCSLHNFHVREM